MPIYTLVSHESSINFLQFSPWLDNEGPIVLLSLANSINFWNISHIQNNKYNGINRNSQNSSSRLRISQRFKSPIKILPINLETSMREMTLMEKNWSNKTGPSHKRELLSCIKFLGKTATKVVTNDDFTRFVTIDNEGNIYHLRLISQSANDDYQLTIDYNGNSSNVE